MVNNATVIMMMIKGQLLQLETKGFQIYIQCIHCVQINFMLQLKTTDVYIYVFLINLHSGPHND